MNVIVVVSDTFRRDNLTCYANTKVNTDNLDRLAADSLVFDRAYTASFPTIPNRTDCFTGKFTFPFYTWSPLRRDETILSDVLTRAGYVTQLICDTPHLINTGSFFSRGFRGWNFIRGQEGDLLRTGANLDVKLPCPREKLRAKGRPLLQHMRNNYYRRTEEDYIAAQSAKAAMQWLDENHKADNWFLWLDMFDPHEPWDPPEDLLALYLEDLSGVRIPHPEYMELSAFTPEEMKYIRAAYLAEVTLVDRWIGKLLDKITQMGLWDNTTLIFTTDHGYYFGEHGVVGKRSEWGLYEEITHLPLIIRSPVAPAPRRVEAIVQPPDLMPTILDLCGVEHPPAMHGRSFYPLISGEARAHRDYAFSSYTLIPTPKAPVSKTTVTHGSWTLIIGTDGTAELYNLENDPHQQNDVIAEHPAIARDLHTAFMGFLDNVGAPRNVIDRQPTLSFP